MSWVEIVVATCTSSGGAGATLVLVAKRAKKVVIAICAEANQPIETQVAAMQLSLATQFGGNGGGMRQAINELQRDVSELKGSVTVLSRGAG